MVVIIDSLLIQRGRYRKSLSEKKALNRKRKNLFSMNKT